MTRQQTDTGRSVQARAMKVHLILGWGSTPWRSTPPHASESRSPSSPCAAPAAGAPVRPVRRWQARCACRRRCRPASPSCANTTRRCRGRLRSGQKASRAAWQARRHAGGTPVDKHVAYGHPSKGRLSAPQGQCPPERGKLNDEFDAGCLDCFAGWARSNFRALVVPRLVLGHAVSWRESTFLVWSGLAVVLVACSMSAAKSKGLLPSVGALFRTLTGRPLGRALVLLGWMWLGWHAFAR